MQLLILKKTVKKRFLVNGFLVNKFINYIADKKKFLFFEFIVLLNIYYFCLLYSIYIPVSSINPLEIGYYPLFLYFLIRRLFISMIRIILKRGNITENQLIFYFLIPFIPLPLIFLEFFHPNTAYALTPEPNNNNLSNQTSSNNNLPAQTSSNNSLPAQTPNNSLPTQAPEDNSLPADNVRNYSKHYNKLNQHFYTMLDLLNINFFTKIDIFNYYTEAIRLIASGRGKDLNYSHLSAIKYMSTQVQFSVETKNMLRGLANDEEVWRLNGAPINWTVRSGANHYSILNELENVHEVFRRNNS